MNIRECVEITKQIVAHNIRCMEKSTALGGTNDYIVPIFIGDPGLGKTAIPQIAARDLDIAYNQTIVAQFDAGELAGLTFPKIVREIDPETGKEVEVTIATRLRPDYLPNETVSIWNLDELPQAFLAQQNVCSQIVNQWKVGAHPVSRGTTIIATGNKPENRAGTTVMPSHLKDRLSFIEVTPDSDEWLDYAQQKQLDFRGRTYIKEFPGNLHVFDAKTDGNPTPRSWEKTCHILSLNLSKMARKNMICGQLGTKFGEKFEQWLRVEDKLPKFDQLLANPMSVPVFDDPKDVSVLYMFLGNCADRASDKTIEPIVTYVKRLKQAEMMAWWLKDTLNQHPALRKNKHVTQLIITHGSKLIGE